MVQQVLKDNFFLGGGGFGVEILEFSPPPKAFKKSAQTPASYFLYFQLDCTTPIIKFPFTLAERKVTQLIKTDLTKSILRFK